MESKKLYVRAADSGAKSPLLQLCFCIFILLSLLFGQACEQDLPSPQPKEPISLDTLVFLADPGDTCRTDTVYFEQQILPILVSNCAITGCHDAQSANKGIITESYASIMRNENLIQRDRVPSATSLFQVINTTDIETVMPPLPNPPLAQIQIKLIEKWLGQGFKNNSCVRVCDTSQITFRATISPIITTFCTRCHSGPDPEAGIDLSTFEGINKSALNGSLHGAIIQNNGYSNMPPEQKLSDCKAEVIRLWIEAGAPEN